MNANKALKGQVHIFFYDEMSKLGNEADYRIDGVKAHSLCTATLRPFCLN